jgi:hypothetical protein
MDYVVVAVIALALGVVLGMKLMRHLIFWESGNKE